ncbi:MAG: pyridoxal-phosphate dependent enzyme [Marinirhabdus sp.]
MRAQPYLDCLLCPVGGGGLLAGTALAVAHYGKNCKTLAGEPAAADDAYRSLKSGSIQTNKNTNTMADGLCTQLGDKNFPIIKKHVTAIVRVEETEIVAAMKFIWGHLKIIIEPSSAVPVAAMLKEPLHFAGKKVGVILSGGNVDLKNLPF